MAGKGYGKGSTVELKPGKWRLFVTRKDVNGVIRRFSEYVDAKGKREANAALDAFKGRIDQGELLAAKSKTFKAFVQQWWPDKAPSIAPTTRAAYLDYLKRYVYPKLGDKPLQEIRTADVAAVLRPLLNCKMCGKPEDGEHAGHDFTNRARTALYVYAVMRIVFKASVEWKERGMSPMAGISRPKVEKQEMQPLDIHDWTKVREYLETSKHAYTLPIFALSITSGARPSEVCGLRWRDADLDAGFIIIRRGSHRIKGQIVESTPKTDRSRRTITLDVGMVALLRQVREKGERLAELAEVPFNLDSPVFTPDGVLPYAPRSISKLWRQVRVKAGVSGRLYDLRHSSASILLDMGVPVVEVSARLGHSSASVTLGVYAHRLQSRQVEVAARLGDVLNGSKAPALAPASD